MLLMCDKNRVSHIWRQTPGMKFRLTCTLYKRTRTLCSCVTDREQKPLAKVVDCVPLGTLSNPGTSDPDLTLFQNRFQHGILNMNNIVGVHEYVNISKNACPRTA